MPNNTSQHILNTSANLLGFCLFVITSIHISSNTETRIIDELTSIVAMMLTLSCTLSFISIRSKTLEKKIVFETFADYLFMIALGGILIIILLITLNFIL